MQQLLFYTTLGCHLCDIAKSLIDPVLQGTEYQLVSVEISEDEQLMEAYGIKIPVLKDPSRGIELSWPFEHEQLVAFLNR